MSDWTGLMTKLQAVNICLGGIGTTSVDDVDAGGLDAQMASDLIDETTAYVQGEGWTWNSETITLTPDADGFLNLPANIIEADTSALSNTVDAVQRGLRLYDKDNNTFVFKAGSYSVDVTLNLTWDELPQTVRVFIAATAAMLMQQRTLGNDNLDKDLQARAKDAWVKIIRADMRDGDYNMLRDNFSSLSVVQRGFFSRGAYL